MTNIARGSGFFRRQLPLLLVLLGGVALSVLVFLVNRDAVESRREIALQAASGKLHRALQARVRLHIDATHAVSDFLAATPDANSESREKFVQSTLARSPGVEFLQWIPAASADSDSVISIAATGFSLPEPDLQNDSLLETARQNSAISRNLAISEPAPLRRDGREFSAIFLYLPVIQPNGEVAGFVSTAIRLETILADLQQTNHIVRAELLDGTPAQNVLAAWNADSAPDLPTRSTRLPIETGDRNWILSLQLDEDPLDVWADWKNWGILAGGLLLTGFATLWLRGRLVHFEKIQQQVVDRSIALTRTNEDLKEQIWQREQTEIQLQESEARFREAFQHAPAGIGLLSREGRWLQVNKALVQITGYSEAELTRFTMADLFPPEEAPHELARFAEILARREETFALELRLRHASGRSIWTLHNVSLVRDAKDQLLYFICQILDITDHRNAIEETRRAKEFSENIIRSSTDGILAFDQQARITVWNSGMEKMTGISSRDALARPAVEILPFLRDPQEIRAFKRILSGTVVKATDRAFSIPSSGKSGFYDAHYSPLHDASGGIVGGVGVVRDVTEQKKARERLHDFTQLLRQRNRELQDFAYVASHDLQEPLRKIRAFGERLQKRAAPLLDEQSSDYLQRMQDAARRMQTLIEDLLSFSRVSTEAHPFSEIDLGQIAREVLADLESRIENTGAQFEIGPLPKIEADPTQMRQLLQNLIGNALKYSKPGEAPHVEISSAEYEREPGFPPLENPGCLIRVRDRGIGFDEKYLDRIFTVFQRLHGRSEYEGTGIGLAICRKIAERHHGWITAQSAPGAGSTFIVALPYKQNPQN